MSQFTKLTKIIANLRKVPYFQRLPTKEQDLEVDFVSTSFVDIEEEILVLTELLKKIHDTTISGDDMSLLMTDIGDSLSHILYHINSMNYYSDIVDLNSK